MRNRIIELCQKCGADLVGFAPISRFPENSAVHRLMPEAKTVIGLGFRVLRGAYRGIEEGSTYYQYTTMGVENMEETVMPMASVRLSMLIEEEGYSALPQRRHQQIMAEENSTNPEVAYDAIYRNCPQETQMDFNEAAVLCGLGEIGFHGALLTDEFGPFVRTCFVLTDMELEASPVKESHLCDKCGKCKEACPGGAIDDSGLDTWQCSVYYRGAHKSNPFIKEDFLENNPDREAILNGEKRFDKESAIAIYPELNFLPNTHFGYVPCLCKKSCEAVCYKHLKEVGKI